MNSLDAAIYTRLGTTTAITSLLASGSNSLFHLQANESASLPYIVWNIQGGGDENLDANRTKNLVLFVRCYSGQSAAAAGSIDAQIDTALHLSPLSPSGWTNIWLAREQDLELVSTEPSGKMIHMAGGLYRCRLDKD